MTENKPEVEITEDSGKDKKHTSPTDPRTYIGKNGKIRKDKLNPIVFHDNKNGGTYFYGKNISKRTKKQL